MVYGLYTGPIALNLVTFPNHCSHQWFRNETCHLPYLCVEDCCQEGEDACGVRGECVGGCKGRMCGRMCEEGRV